MTLFNPIDEIKRIRHELGAQADYDIHRVFAELRKLESSSGRSYVRHNPRRVSDNKAMHPRGGGTIPGGGKSTPAAG